MTSPRLAAASTVALWLLATALFALAPALYFVSGSSDSATEADRIGLAAIPVLAAWLLLVLAVRLTRRSRPVARALALLAFIPAVLFLARRLGSAPALEGDTAWTLFWVAVGVAWVALSAVCLRR